MSGRRYTVAFLAGDGVGPELTAEATRALAAVAPLHGFEVEQVHAPFGAEALSRHGQLVPAPTRQAVLEADAVLVASRAEPALRLLEADLDERAAATRVRVGRDADVVVLRPLDDCSSAWTVERAFALACERRAHVSVVTSNAAFRAQVEAAADEHPGVRVEQPRLSETVRALALSPERFDVVLGDTAFGSALAEVAAAEDDERVVATGRLAEHGPSLFAPSHGRAAAIAGQGVANPSSMLLALSLLLGEGLGERAAAETIGEAVAEALRGGVHTPDVHGERAASGTRDFVDVVLGLFQVATPNAEFARRVWA